MTRSSIVNLLRSMLGGAGGRRRGGVYPCQVRSSAVAYGLSAPQRTFCGMACCLAFTT